MLVHKVFAAVKEIFPPKAAELVRAIFTALLTPLYFSYETGHFRSSLQRRPVDKNGNPIPWYTYPAIAFLAGGDFRERAVLEFGAGHSTLWWASRAREIVSFEEHAQWREYVQSIAPANVRVVAASRNLEDIQPHLQGRRFDVVVIDGLDRVKASVVATEVIAPDGVIIVDNSDICWGPQGVYPIMDHFRAANFYRMDFYGYTSSVMVTHCTSLLFKEHCFLLRGERNPVRRVAGGEAFATARV